ncbi:MAG: bifunctional hydroxymethylpyrimidine kinase/phosphomethylpyrimidine kinase [Panacagrimonas sp.]
MMPLVKRVLCLSGHDPTGGAGIHADIEAVAAQGGHALSIVTALTVQDTRNVRHVEPVAAALIERQLAALEEDGPFDAIKIGLIGSAAQVHLMVDLIRRSRVPLVFDPVLRAGGGADLVDPELQATVLDQLVPLVDLMTPNLAEARRFVPDGNSGGACAASLLATGCRNVLVTGGDIPGPTVLNIWFRADAEPRHFEWPRLDETFHGAGCTLASAIAGQLALGASMAEAIVRGQQWTQAALTRAVAVGCGRRIPFRR